MKLQPSLTPELTAWALRQPVFFVASAPTHGRHVNVSPKGLAGATFSVLSPNRIAYLDRTGSGCETIAHVYENGRVTVMFMSFGASPRIMRLFCRGRVVEWDAQPEFGRWLDRMGKPRPDAVRSVIVLDVWQVQTSCGYGVPRVRRELYAAAAAAADGGVVAGPVGSEAEAAEEEEEEKDRGDETAENGFAAVQFADELCVFEDRPTLAERGAWRERAGKVLSYQVEVNLDSLDGLPGLRVARREVGQWLWLTDTKARLRRIWAEKDAIVFGFLLAVFVYLVVSMGVLQALALAGSRTLPVLKRQFRQWSAGV